MFLKTKKKYDSFKDNNYLSDGTITTITSNDNNNKYNDQYRNYEIKNSPIKNTVPIKKYISSVDEAPRLSYKNNQSKNTINKGINDPKDLLQTYNNNQLSKFDLNYLLYSKSEIN